MYWQRGVLVNRIIEDSKFEEIIEIQSGFGFGKSERFQDRIPSKNAMKQVFQLQLSPLWNSELEIQNRLKVHFGTYLASFCNFSWISHTFWTTINKIKLYLPSLKATWAILVSSGKKFRYDTSLGRYSWSLTNLSWILMNFVLQQTGLKNIQRKL